MTIVVLNSFYSFCFSRLNLALQQCSLHIYIYKFHFDMVLCFTWSVICCRSTRYLQKVLLRDTVILTDILYLKSALIYIHIIHLCTIYYIIYNYVLRISVCTQISNKLANHDYYRAELECYTLAFYCFGLFLFLIR